MTLTLSPDVAALNPGLKVGKIKGAPRIAAADLAADPYKSDLERQFAKEQADLIFVPGRWLYEPFTLNLDGQKYTPDFFGPLADGRGLGAVEVKGWNKNLRADKTKFRAAVQEHPWLTFGWMVRSKREGWQVQWYERKGLR